ncbi:hypothetical protein GEMRC1_008957 [Eukaryota sp. GEM-RC1]
MSHSKSSSRVIQLNDDLINIDDATALTEEEIKILFDRFQHLDRDGSGGLDEEEIENLTDFSLNPLRRHLLQALDTNKDTTIDFAEFLSAYSAFSSNGDKEQRIELLFKVYDANRDGFICHDELLLALSLMVGDNLSPEELEQVTQKTIVQVDRDKDGKISFQEFRDFLINRVDFNFDQMSLSIAIPE